MLPADSSDAKHAESALEWRFSARPSLLELRHRLWHHRQHLAQAAAIAAVLAGLPAAVAIGLHFLPLPCVVMAVVGVWRSADKYRGDPTWPGIAKAAVTVWGVLMVFI
jgi:hypothetical protein